MFYLNFFLQKGTELYLFIFHIKGQSLKKSITKLLLIFLLFILTSFLFSNDNTSCNFIKLKQIDGQWYFIDPNGDPFLIRGVHHVNYNTAKEKNTGRKYYKEFVKEYFSLKDDSNDEWKKKWAENTLDTLKKIGFNTIGNWSPTELLKDKLEKRRLYYVTIMYLPRGGWVSSGLDDYFSDGFKKHAEKIVKQEIELHDFTKDKNLIGYFIGGELKWGGDWRGLQSIFVDYLNMPVDSSGKIEMINFLADKYGRDIKKLNKDWLTFFKSWNQALKYQKYKALSNNAKKIEKEGIYIIAKQFYKISRELIKKYDENHLIMGDMLLAPVTPHEVLKACGEYMDLISVNYYPLISNLQKTIPDILGHMPTKDSLQAFYDLTKKPILVSEFGFRGKTKDTPSTRPFIYPTYLSQKARGKKIYEYISKLLQKDYIIGYIIYRWVDNPKKGADFGVGENNNWGIVSVKNVIYKEYVDYLKKANRIKKN